MDRGEVGTVSMGALHPLLRHGCRVGVAHDGLAQVVDAVVEVKSCRAPQLLTRMVVIGVGGPSYRVLEGI